MNIPMALVSLIVPFIYIFGGILTLTHPPEYGSSRPAYRTEYAKKSRRTWDYANHSFSVVCIFMGIYLAAFTGLVDAILRKFPAGFAWAATVALIIVQIVLVLLPRGYVEKNLKFLYDENGEERFPDDIDVKEEEDDGWEDWDTWVGAKEKDKEDGWLDWDEWLKQRDKELDEERAERKAAEEAGIAAAEDGEDSSPDSDGTEEEK